MVKSTQYAKIPFWLTFIAVVGGILGLCLSPYQLKEIFVCWLFFSLTFGLLALAILVIVVTCSMVEGILHWARAASAKVSKVPLGVPHLHPK